MTSTVEADPPPGDGEQTDAGKLREPSMGPACLVIVILGLAIFSIVCAFGSFFFFSDQPALAKRGITEQLVPWIEESNLAPNDKREILADLELTVDRVESGELTSRQLSRLKNALEDNPVLLWGNVEGILARAPAAGLSEVELTAGRRVAQRLLRAAAERKMGRNDLVFALEPCTHNRSDGLALEVNATLTAKQIQDFLGRAERFADGMEIPHESYEKTVPVVFRALLAEALSVK